MVRLISGWRHCVSSFEMSVMGGAPIVFSSVFKKSIIGRLSDCGIEVKGPASGCMVFSNSALQAAHAERTRDWLSAVPQYARMLHRPVDAQGLVDLHVLAGLHAASAEDALMRIVGIERVRSILGI